MGVTPSASPDTAVFVSEATDAEGTISGRGSRTGRGGRPHHTRTHGTGRRQRPAEHTQEPLCGPGLASRSVTPEVAQGPTLKGPRK